MQTLRTALHTQFYETYREKRLSDMGFADTNDKGESVRYGVRADNLRHLKADLRVAASTNYLASLLASS